MSQDICVVVEHLRGQVTDISYVMVAAARGLARAAGGRVIAVLLGHDARALAATLAADQVVYLDHPALADFASDSYQRALAAMLLEDLPRVVLLGHTAIGMDVAGGLSARLGVPLVCSCFRFGEDGSFVSQICGGKILAQGELPAPVALVTLAPGGYRPEEGQGTTAPPLVEASVPSMEGLRVTLKGYLEPEVGDVDIAREPVLVAVGRGIQTQDNISLAEELAQALGGVVCASRPVVDQGWLAASRLVGKSGKSVKPKVYLALGISGAPEHMEATGASETIIAVNTDAAAPIFNLAKYGAVVDLLDLVPALTEKVRAAKG
jgi:electron transfer flavoprotein alpha subunit